MAAVANEAAAASIEGSATETIEKPLPHKLERKWTFWFDNQSKPNQGAAWGTSLRKIYSFDTVEEFWCLYEQIFKPSKLPGNADFHLFRAGIEPKWEDPVCATGGKWSVTSSGKANLDTMWLETLMALIGEQFDEADEICGVVASVRRQRQDKLALWTKTAANEAVQVVIISFNQSIYLALVNLDDIFLGYMIFLCRQKLMNVRLTRALLAVTIADFMIADLMSIGRKWKEVIDVTNKITYSFHDDSKRERNAKSRYTV
ncbi:hypothetical protein POTOM_035657 [Populus tomentosa]|uniref:Eukaryotic translation initiation factor isoform 4E n=1 Tax=Populus tomentosa TaxID=118781 RepID=A0A8X7YTG7_POPTO|nr:hypothetical protein POTOM_035657 [Populus tomentosa]